MDGLRLLVTLLPLSLTAGINLYATVLIVGLSISQGWVQNPPAGLEAFGSPVVIILAGVLYIVEFVADKVQFVDNAWDAVHTFIRPVGAALMGMAALSQVDPVVAIVGALLAGGISLFAHGGKATARVAMNASSPLENVSNIGISLAEDAFVAVLAFLALKMPYLAATLAILAIIIIAIVVPPFLRWSFFTLKAFGNWVVGLWNQATRTDVEPDQLPAEHLALLHEYAPDLAVQCKAQNVRGADGCTGYLASWGDRLVFTYNKWWASHAWHIEQTQVKNSKLYHRPLTEILEITYEDPRGKLRIARFVFMKDRVPLAERLATGLQAGGLA
ncbi:MAG: DUF4126 domain-containing protein [Chloroflexota bacterium]